MSTSPIRASTPARLEATRAAARPTQLGLITELGGQATTGAWARPVAPIDATVEATS